MSGMTDSRIESGESMSGIQVRRMEAADAEAVSCMEQQIFSMPWSRQGFLDALTGENAIFLVAEAEGRIAGYCGMYCAAEEGEITNVAVEAAYRRSGIGTKLMESLLTEAKDAGIKTVILEVRSSNGDAIRLYEKFGFELQGVRKGFYEKPKEDGCVMILSQ